MRPELKTITPNQKRGLVAVALIAVVSTWAAIRQCDAEEPVPSAPPALPQLPVTELADAGVVPLTAVPTTAQIVFTTVPPSKALVSWGKKRLGRIDPHKPLVIVRPRDSGPLDVIVRAEGFLPVHTRAHTFSDNKVVVRLTPPEQTNALLGYRVPIDAGVPLESADAGISVPFP